jgi:hypothetical protein
MGDAKFKATDYNGGFESHPTPEPEVTFVLQDGGWQLHYPKHRAGLKKVWQYSHGKGVRFQVEPLTDKTCRVTIGSGSFTVHASAENVGRESEQRAQAAQAAAERTQRIAKGDWWLAKDAFKGLGFIESWSVSETEYMGGYSASPKALTGKFHQNILKIDRKGVSLNSIKNIFTIPWSEVVDIEVDDPGRSKHVTAGRAVLLGPLALAARKTTQNTLILVQLRNGDEVVFHTAKATGAEVRTKLAPVMSQLRKASATTPTPSAPPSSAAPASQAPNVADQLTSLAALHQAGTLTDEEFAAAKAKLLG